MSTPNIVFYEEISKMIPYLSSNIIKFAPYLFFWSLFVCVLEFNGPINNYIQVNFDISNSKGMGKTLRVFRSSR